MVCRLLVCGFSKEVNEMTYQEWERDVGIQCGYAVYCRGTYIGSAGLGNCKSFIELRKRKGGVGYYVVDMATGEIVYE